MRILALDPAEKRVGWALGDAGKMPLVGVYDMRLKYETIEDALGGFAAWLMDKLTESEGGHVDLVAIESYIPIGGMRGFTNPATQEAAILIHGAVRAICGPLSWDDGRVTVEAVHAATVRKHFCGRATAAPKRRRGYVRTSKERAGDRDETKAMVIKQAQFLGYISGSSGDDDKADACAIFDYAASSFGRTPSAFKLTAEPSARRKTTP